MFELLRKIFPLKRKRLLYQGFSIICACNDYDKLDRYLIPSLNRQKSPHELFVIDNSDGHYSSAASILNQTAKKAQYDYLMFVHQDVALLSETWLFDTQNRLNSLKNLGAAGVAGRGKRGRVKAAVLHGIPPRPAGREPLQNNVKVQTLDGCLLIVPKHIFERLPFDEAHSGWYLYVAGYCLDLLRNGYQSYVIPELIYHESTGPADPCTYEGAIQYLIAKHGSRIDTIYTTVGKWKTK
ncbi:MAG: hypothetical protein JW902_13440 [Syntrophaceae bacterium]|nr:hypothetical protein [Syntrophaceae bacterium]